MDTENKDDGDDLGLSHEKFGRMTAEQKIAWDNKISAEIKSALMGQGGNEYWTIRCSCLEAIKQWKREFSTKDNEAALFSVTMMFCTKKMVKEIDDDGNEIKIKRNDGTRRSLFYSENIQMVTDGFNEWYKRMLQFHMNNYRQSANVEKQVKGWCFIEHHRSNMKKNRITTAIGGASPFHSHSVLVVHGDYVEKFRSNIDRFKDAHDKMDYTQTGNLLIEEVDVIEAWVTYCAKVYKKMSKSLFYHKDKMNFAFGGNVQSKQK